jgi:hypothetical protein
LLRHTIALVVDEIRSLEMRIATIDRQLAQIARTHPVAVRLQQIPGNRSVTAAPSVSLPAFLVQFDGFGHVLVFRCLAYSRHAKHPHLRVGRLVPVRGYAKGWNVKFSGFAA